MNIRVRNFFLKSIPYLLSIAGGLTIFIVASDEIHDENLNDLINNISASLLSIPLVFLLYDYSNYLISRRVNRTLAAGVTVRVNSVMAGLQQVLRTAAGVRKNVSFGEFERLLAARQVSFRRSKLTVDEIGRITQYRDQLDDVVYRIAATGALAHTQVQTLSLMARELSHVLELHRIHGTRSQYIKRIDNIIALIGDWYDSVSLRSDEANGVAVGGASS